MLQCTTCRNQMSCGLKDVQYNVKCRENGEVRIASTFRDTFTCDDYAEKEATQEPPTDNVMIVLKSGRDFFVRDESVASELDLVKGLAGDCDGSHVFISLGGIAFKVGEIAAFAYLGGTT